MGRPPRAATTTRHRDARVPSRPDHRSVLVQVLGDDSTEGDETFDLDLANPVNATLGTHPTVVTIQDNDPIPPGSAVLNVTGATIREGNTGTTMLTFTVTRSGDTMTPVNVDYLTANGDRPRALGLREHRPAPSRSQRAMTTATVAVQIKGDKQLEHLERFFLSLINPSARGQRSSMEQATGSINDDDTRTRFTTSKVRGVIRVRGRLSPAHPGKRMVVTLFRRKNGAWMRVAARRPLLVGHVRHQWRRLQRQSLLDPIPTTQTRPLPDRGQVPRRRRSRAEPVTKSIRC